MKIKKFLNPAEPLLRNYVAQNDVTYVPLSRIIQKYELPGYITLTDGTKVKPDNTVTKVSPLSNTLPQQQAYYNAIGKEKDKKEKLSQQIEEAGRITLGALDAIATLPSRTIGAVKDAKSGNKSFISSMIEGNEGLGNKELNTLANFIGPAAFTKGLQVFSKGIQTAADLQPLLIQEKWTLIGNKGSVLLRSSKSRPQLIGYGNYPGKVSTLGPDYSLYPDFSKMTRAEKVQYLKTQQELAEQVDLARNLDALHMTKDRLKNGGFKRIRKAYSEDVARLSDDVEVYHNANDIILKSISPMNERTILNEKPIHGTASLISNELSHRAKHFIPFTRESGGKGGTAIGFTSKVQSHIQNS